MRYKIFLCIIFFVNVYYEAVALTHADTLLIKQHLTAITKTKTFRTHHNIDALNKTAAYIKDVFALYADTVYEQHFFVNGKSYKNIVCSFGTQHTKQQTQWKH